MTAKLLALFFDLDGTILDVMERYYQAHVSAAQEHNIPVQQKNSYTDQKRKKIKEQDIVNVPDEKFKQYNHTRIENLEIDTFLAYDVLFPGTTAILAKLQENHYLLYIATLRRHKNRVLREVRKHHLDRYFNAVLSVPPGSNPMESKKKLIETMKHEYSQAEQKVIIGDTEADILAGKALGFTTIAVSQGIRHADYLEELKPDYLIDTIKDLFDIPIFK